MTNALAAVRTTITDALAAAGITVYDHVPARPNPPAAVITPGTPYLERAEQFGTYRVRYTVSLIVRAGANDKTTEDLDALIVATVAALDPVIDIESSSTFYPYESNGASYLACDIDAYDLNDLKGS